MARILILEGHPEPGPGRFCQALADAYAEGAAAGGHEVRRIDVAGLDVPVLRSREAWENGPAPPAIAPAQDAIRWAEHLVIVFLLWLGSMPALLKAFFEQAFRPDFTGRAQGSTPAGGLSGRSARVIVTMGMPGWLYRLWFGAAGVRSLDEGILGIVGIKPARRTIIGWVEGVSDAKRRAWLDTVRNLGRAAR